MPSISCTSGGDKRHAEHGRRSVIGIEVFFDVVGRRDSVHVASLNRSQAIQVTEGVDFVLCR